VGRLAITAIVVLLAPWGGSAVSVFVFWPIYLLVAVAVLRQTWKKGVVETTSVRELAAAGPTPVAPALRGPIPRSTMVAWAALGLLAIGLVVVWTATGQVVHASLGIASSLALAVVLVRSLLSS
jgi:hypothetical protein